MNQEQLRSLSDTHFKAAVALQNVTAEMIDCIDSILRCLNLIRWLREELKGKSVVPGSFQLFGRLLYDFFVTK